ncbi:CCA tRNA nucleotidyltransferase [Verrucomicrobiota bacterium]
MLILKKLRDSGHQTYFAGGCVRDELLGRTPKDYDIATSALPEDVEALFKKTVAIGKAFGVIAVVIDGHPYEVATFREEFGYQDGRRPEGVHFCAPEEDAKRRDFTVNGMFSDPVENRVIDFVDGQEDLHKKVIRAIGEPEKRFEEDHLRMLRAVRFTHTLGFEMEPATRAAITKFAPLIKKISMERIEQEFTRLLTESIKPGEALRDLLEIGLLKEIMPELLPMVGMEQPPQYHPEGDVFEHTCLMLNLMDLSKVESARELAYTVLLHDVGKPPTKSIGPGRDGKPRIRFDGHASEGAKMAEHILRRFRIPNKEQKHILQAIKDHMRFVDIPHMRKATKRRLVGSETFPLELELHRVDCAGSHEDLSNYDLLLQFQEEMANEPVLPDPWVTGRDLIELGLKPGPDFKAMLDAAYQRQMNDEATDKESLLIWLKHEYKLD